jgi:hypothetical protein
MELYLHSQICLNGVALQRRANITFIDEHVTVTRRKYNKNIVLVFANGGCVMENCYTCD